MAIDRSGAGKNHRDTDEYCADGSAAEESSNT
jgi:hypothetical protein